MRYFELFEDFASRPNEWVHYSNVPYIKINPKQFHQDAAGIYCFPKNFKPVGMWTKYRYKFTVVLKPSANTLDLAHVTEAEIYAMIDKAGIRDSFDAHITAYPPKNMNKKMDQAWESLVRYYCWENGEGSQYAKFNKMLRSLSYDAIFDDGKIVHCAEEQLIVLNPRCIRVIRMEERAGSGFDAMKRVLADVVELSKKFGEVDITPPKKIKDRYSNKASLEAQVKVSRGEENYLYFKLNAAGEKDAPPDVIHVSALYSRPSLGAGYGVSYNIMTGAYAYDEGLRELQNALEKTFPRNDA